MAGLFIALEGPDGSGKTTISKELQKRLEDKGYDLLMTREPGGTPIGEEIRDIILDVDNKNLSYEAEALLYAASRAQHVHQVIEPGLKAGKIVISDRFILSSLAYQGVGRDLGIKEVKYINDFGIRGINPDLILFFHIDPEETLKRKTISGGGDRLELEGNTFHKKVYEGYMELIELYKDKLVLIDATGTIEEVTERALQVILDKIEERSN